MPGKLSKADWAQKNEEKIMPIIKLDPSDLVEMRNFMMWIKRELRLFAKQPKLQEEVADNLEKVTSLPLKEFSEAMYGG